MNKDIENVRKLSCLQKIQEAIDCLGIDEKKVKNEMLNGLPIKNLDGHLNNMMKGLAFVKL